MIVLPVRVARRRHGRARSTEMPDVEAFSFGDRRASRTGRAALATPRDREPVGRRRAARAGRAPTPADDASTCRRSWPRPRSSSSRTTPRRRRRRLELAPRARSSPHRRGTPRRCRPTRARMPTPVDVGPAPMPLAAATAAFARCHGTGSRRGGAADPGIAPVPESLDAVEPAALAEPVDAAACPSRPRPSAEVADGAEVSAAADGVVADVVDDLAADSAPAAAAADKGAFAAMLHATPGVRADRVEGDAGPGTARRTGGGRSPSRCRRSSEDLPELVARASRPRNGRVRRRTDPGRPAAATAAARPSRSRRRGTGAGGAGPGAAHRRGADQRRSPNRSPQSHWSPRPRWSRRCRSRRRRCRGASSMRSRLRRRRRPSRHRSPAGAEAARPNFAVLRRLPRRRRTGSRGSRYR